MAAGRALQQQIETDTGETTSETRKRIIKNPETPIQKHRRLVQFGFLVLTIWIGIEFALFVHNLRSGAESFSSRPPGVEAFLPLSALISLKYWLLTGIFNTIHPSALVILLIVLTISLFLKKGFCSWVCPFGLFSEYLEKIHLKVFDRHRRLPNWLDYPLRSLKYFLVGFFLWAILIKMSVQQLELFIYSPYNKVADIKMFDFFANMSDTTLWTLTILVLLSILIPHFWCRYLCPYGAFVGLVSLLSPFKIRRNPQTCTDCEKCSKVCPANIAVHRAKTVRSDECHACFRCVDACPIKDTLYFSAKKDGWRLPKKLYPVFIVGFFLIGMVAGKLTGRWQNSISEEEYRYHIQHIQEYHHNRGEVPRYPSSTNFKNPKKQVRKP